MRLRELLGDSEPGKPAISLAVGEPQHAVPPFVGPVLAAHIGEFGRYPMNNGIDALCEAAAGWLGRRFALPRPIDPCTRFSFSTARARACSSPPSLRRAGSAADAAGQPC